MCATMCIWCNKQYNAKLVQGQVKLDHNKIFEKKCNCLKRYKVEQV